MFLEKIEVKVLIFGVEYVFFIIKYFIVKWFLC